MGRDFKGHVGHKADAYDMMHAGYGYRERNSGGVIILDVTPHIFKHNYLHKISFTAWLA